MGELQDRVAVITGGTSGLGEASAKAFAKEGAKVAVVGRNSEHGQQIVKEITADNGKAIFIEMDVTKGDEVKTGIQKVVDELGTVDILLNSAGIHDGYKDVTQADEESFDKIWEVNVTGVFLITKEVVPMMVEKEKGTVITIGSQGSFVAGPGGIAYVTSKHALVGFNKQLAFEFGAKGIKANLIAPGFIATPMTEDIDDPRLKDIPAQRAGTPAEVASVAVFLASDESNYMQGSEVTIDGGWTIGR
ncbi:SDR family NAD(P)-dependent oxidoreductase [Carnobacterium funditum]|uniref:SDR family NAD(P)-dependent oxidoreductase n=1 Tax=Carnobacterium funditum TaxID=2752 RepID=UPI00068DDBC6|nr:SDR family oxidoreductase [Carnobacterium funditum]